MTLIEQLDCDRARIIEILNSHGKLESPSSSNLTIDTLYKMYIDNLDDSLETLNLIIGYLKQSA